MATIIQFLPDDRQVLEAMLEIFSRSAGSCLTLEGLLDRWTALVDQLGGEARASFDEYEAQLCVRGLLEELVECLSEPGRQVLLRTLAGPDRRFLALTVAGSGPSARVWWQRVPPERDERLMRRHRELTWPRIYGMICLSWRDNGTPV